MKRFGILFFLSFLQFLCAQNGSPTVEDIDGWGKVSVDKLAEKSGVFGEGESAQRRFKPDREGEHAVEGFGVLAGSPTHDDEKPKEDEDSNVQGADLRKVQQETRTGVAVIPVANGSEQKSGGAVEEAREVRNGGDSAVVKPEASAAIPVASDSTSKGNVRNNSFLWNLISVPFSYVGYVFNGFINITGLSRLFIGFL